MTKEKVRIYQLARELDMESKDLLDVCRQFGLDVKNQLSSVDPEDRDRIVQMVKSGTSSKTAQAPKARATPVLPQTQKPIRNLTQRKPAQESKKPAPAAEEKQAPAAKPAAEAAPAPQEAEAKPAPAKEKETPAAPLVEAEQAAQEPEAGARPEKAAPAAKEAAAKETAAPPQEPKEGKQPTAPAASAPSPPAPMPSYPPKVPTITDKKIRDLKPAKGEKEKPRPQPARSGRPSSYNISAPPTPPKSFTGKEGKKHKEKTQKKIAALPPELLKEAAEGRVRPEHLLPKSKQEIGAAPSEDEDEEKPKSKKDRKRRPGVGDRQERKKAREARAQQRKHVADVKLDHGHVVVEEDDRGVATKLKQKKKHRKIEPQHGRSRQSRVIVAPPITVRSLCEALGVKSSTLLFKLMNYGLPRNVSINMTLEPEVAEELALEEGCELEIKRPPDVEEELLAQFEQPDEPDQLVPRAPIVTVMGHVDHGKTSLLDRIRESNVVASEAGGITQVIRAWRVEHDGKPITFLDTPGHEAFTKMRARGAQVTDIAVIVVAADDGVMPQTEEAINHAKAANVALVVAINKVDMPNANVNKTRQQLYSMNVLPDNMGGDTPFVETSAVTGQGIDELLESISLVAELKELKANPNKLARGLCLEAMLSEEEGVQATLLVREGTLHRGDTIICGASYGRIRQMYNDLGRSIEEAGPSVPVRITGLDEVPNADDPFIVAPDLATARQIADKRKQKLQEAALTPRAALSPFGMNQQISELKVILKADFRGSIEAIRKELEKLKHEEVRVKLLHTGIGGISESDVQLALTSPEDTMIVGFNVVPDDRAKTLADEKGIPIREYNVIYMLTDDIKAALEGKLKPRQEIVHLGRAVVRETFKVSRVGTIAGCYVTQGTIPRNAKVRVIREGAVIYPPPERTVGLESLKRFKDDVAEVREGFECGMKVVGYDDIKVDDVIEAYRIEEVQRTLDSQ